MSAQPTTSTDASASASPEKPRRNRLFLAAAGGLFVVALLALVGAEIILRVSGFYYSPPLGAGRVTAFEAEYWRDFTEPDLDILYRFKPVDNRGPVNEFGLEPGHSARINDRGYRGENFSDKKSDPDATRVLIYADSIFFGVQVPEEKTIPALLEKGLNERGLNVEVLSLSLPSYTSAQNVWDFETGGDRLDGDVLIVQFGSWNDTAAPPNRKTDAEVREELLAMGHEPSLLFQNSRLVQFIQYQLDKLALKSLKSSRPKVSDQGHWLYRYQEPGLTRRVPLADFKANVQRFLSLAKERDMPVLVVIAALPSHSREVLKEVVPPYKSYLRNLPESEDVQVLDLQPIIDAAGGDALFMDFCHLLPAGCAAVAEGIEDAAAELVKRGRKAGRE
jgi:lysophospholipase L1-like esterase